MTTITRSIEIDAGHRVPGHLGKCRNIHGHRYKIEVTIQGPVQREGSEEGMVLDFGTLKEAMVEVIEKRCDHALLLSVNDDLINHLAEGESIVLAIRQCVRLDGYLQCLGYGGLMYVLPFIPTAEGLAEHWFKQLEKTYCGWTIVNVRVYETPNCWADYPGTHQP